MGLQRSQNWASRLPICDSLWAELFTCQSFLCSAATRDRDVILIDNALYKVITEMDVQLEASRFPFSQLPVKAQQLTSAAYEVHDCVVNAETGLLFSQQLLSL